MSAYKFPKKTIHETEWSFFAIKSSSPFKINKRKYVRAKCKNLFSFRLWNISNSFMIIQNGQRSMNEHMKDRIELIYDEAYDFIDQALTKIRALDKNDLQAENEEVQEKAERTEFALQAARDILENMIIPGKKLTFIYEKGSVVVEIPDKK
ncbi:hypothetical protein [Priestia megaterium]|nr:hypothetical protein [Priestia megaterium]